MCLLSEPRRFIAQINVYLKSEALKIWTLNSKEKSIFHWYCAASSSSLVQTNCDAFRVNVSWIICYDYCRYYYFYLTWGCAHTLRPCVCLCECGAITVDDCRINHHKKNTYSVLCTMCIVYITLHVLYNHWKMQAPAIKPLINNSSSSITFGINYIVNSFVTFFFSLSSVAYVHHCCCCCCGGAVAKNVTALPIRYSSTEKCSSASNWFAIP